MWLRRQGGLRFISRFGFAVCAATLLVMPATAFGQRRPDLKSIPPQNEEALLLKKLDALFADLTPVSSGTGVIIFEPISAGADESVLQFGAGCSRWLQYVIGGQPEIGKTPTWGSIATAGAEMGYQTMRLPLGTASRVGEVLGVTHVVVGEIKRNGDKIELAYNVHPVGQATPVLTVTLAGSDTAIVEGLPAAAVKIVRALGVSEPKAPGACMAGASGLRVMGKVPWIPLNAVFAEDLRALDEVATREPAAALLSHYAARNRPSIAAARQTIYRAAHENTYAQHTLVSNFVPKLTEVPADMRKMAGNYPNNYLLNASLLRCAELMHDTQEEVRVSRRGVQISPRNSHAWNRLAKGFSDYGSGIRRGRLASALTPDEWDKLDMAYAAWTVAAKKATDLAPKSADYWHDLATAACFAGLDGTADQAFWKAVSLNPNSFGTLSWGLEMYQPKWQGDPPKLDRVVSLCVSGVFASKAEGVTLARHIALVDPKYKAESDKLLARMEGEAKAALARDSTDTDANQALALITSNSSNRRGSSQYLLALAKQNPDDERTLVNLSWLVPTPAEGTEITALLRKSVAKHPDSAVLRLALGRTLFQQKDFDAAVKAFRDVPPDTKEGREAETWIGSALKESGRKAEAVEYYRERLQSHPKSEAAYGELIGALRDVGKTEEALALGRKAKELFSASKYVRSVLLELLEKANDFAGAAEELRYLADREENRTLRIDKLLVLGQYLVKANQREDAIKVFKALLQEEPTGGKAEAARDLLHQLGSGAVEAPTGAYSSAAGALVLARSLQSDNARQEKIAVLRDAVTKWPNDAGLLVELGQTLLWEKRPLEAEHALRDAVKANPMSRDARLLLAQSVSMQKRTNEAALLYQDVLRLDPRDPSANYSLVELLVQLNRYTEASAACKRALEADPENPSLRQRHAMILMNLGDYKNAVDAYGALLKLMTNKTDAAGNHVLIGSAWMGLSRRDEAIKEWRLALELDPSGPFAAGAKRFLDNPALGMPSPPSRAASVAVRQSSPDATSVPSRSVSRTAQTTAQSAPRSTSNSQAQSPRPSAAPPKANPPMPMGAANELPDPVPAIPMPPPVPVPAEAQALIDQAENLRKNGKLKEAGDLYASALKIEPRVPQAHFGLGMTLMFTGKAQQAVAELGQAAVAMPADSQAQHFYGVSLMAAGRPKEALTWLRRAADLDQTNESMQDTFVVALLNAGLPDSAITAAAVVKKRLKAYHLYFERVARAYEMKGDIEAALRQYRLGLANAADKSSGAVFHTGIGKMLLKLGKKEEARKELEAATESDPPGFKSEARILLDNLK